MRVCLCPRVSKSVTVRVRAVRQRPCGCVGFMCLCVRFCARICMHARSSAHARVRVRVQSVFCHSIGRHLPTCVGVRASVCVFVERLRARLGGCAGAVVERRGPAV